MAPPRIFLKLKGELAPGTRIPLPRHDSHHLINVLRLPLGTEILLASPHGERELRSKLVSIDIPAIVEIEGQSQSVQTLQSSSGLSHSAEVIIVKEPVVQTLIVALLKGKKNDLVVEKVTELGIKRILFFGAERSVAKITEAAKDDKVARWQKVAEAAAKQSQRSSIPEIIWCQNLSALTAKIPIISASSDMLILASLSPEAGHPRDLRPPPSRAHLLIGPEGDLSPDEHAVLVGKGFKPVTLGRTILRAETAAIAGVAALNLLWG